MKRCLSRFTNIPALQPFFHRVSNGWDPVSSGYAAQYALGEWEHRETIAAKCRDIEERIRGLTGKKVLDLGAGPGQYTVAFAVRGANVTWHDPSRNYLMIARDEAARAHVEFDWHLGYLKEVADYDAHTFDFIFCRICWYYCASDRKLASHIVRLLKPGGCAWVDTPVAGSITSGPWMMKLACFLYARTGLKLAHLRPPRGKVAGMLARNPGVQHISVDYSRPGSERIWCATRPAED